MTGVFTGAAQAVNMNDVSACKPVCDALVEQNPDVGRSQAAALVMEGLVLVNGLPARHPGQVVGPTDHVTIAGTPMPVKPRLVVVT